MRWDAASSRNNAINAAKAANALRFGPIELARVFERPVTRNHGDTIARLIEQWRLSPEWKAYAPDTHRLYEVGLKKIENRWGNVPLEVFDNPRMHAKIMSWRASLAATPAGTDNLITALSSLLSFGVARGKLRINVAAGIGDLYQLGRRAGIIWTQEEIERLVQTAHALGRQLIADAVRLVSETGFRLLDLISVGFEHVLDHAIVKTLHKRTRAGHSVAVIPRNPRLDLVLDMLRGRPRSPGMNSLLVNHHGQSWRDYNLGIGFRLVRDTCGIGHLDARTGDYIPKTLHDLRRTYATRLMTECNLSDEEVATILGWTVDYAAKIRWVYVDERTRVEAIGRLLADQTSHKVAKFYV